MFVISRYDQYTEGLQADIDQWMRDMPLVSIDTESHIGESKSFTVQTAFAQSLCAVIFRLDRLWQFGDRRSRRPMDLLPAHLLDHLWDALTVVLVLVSGESRHFRPICLVGVQHLFTLNRHWFSYTNSSMSLKHFGKSGVALISMITNNYCHKPMKRNLAEDWFSGLGPYQSKLGWCHISSLEM